ncbi:hypothetical protein ACP70R_043005 [Stipagrostis hirtigluma subsp. patula]
MEQCGQIKLRASQKRRLCLSSNQLVVVTGQCGQVTMAAARLHVSLSVQAATLILCVLLPSFVLGCLSSRPQPQPVTDRNAESNLGGLEIQEQWRLVSTTAGSTRLARSLGMDPPNAREVEDAAFQWTQCGLDILDGMLTLFETTRRKDVLE